jgi:hypothetical protein
MLRIETGNMREGGQETLMYTHGNGTWNDVNFIPVSSRFAFGIPRGIVVEGNWSFVSVYLIEFSSLTGSLMQTRL